MENMNGHDCLFKLVMAKAKELKIYCNSDSGELNLRNILKENTACCP